MASLRGSTLVWDNHSVVQNDVSPAAFVGTQTNIVVLIYNKGTNSHNATFKIQVAAPSSLSAGRNVDPDRWYDLSGQTSITVNAAATLAINLAPFAPTYLRLIRTDNNGAESITVEVAGIGQN